MTSFTSGNQAAYAAIYGTEPEVFARDCGSAASPRGNTTESAAGPWRSPAESVPSASAAALRTTLAYLAATLFCALFGAVYELFSHGVFSYFMIYAFAIPLVLGALPSLVRALKALPAPCKRAANAWSSGVATLTVGCIFQGALEIYGTTNQLAIVYPVAAAVLLVAGIAFHVHDRLQGAGTRGEAPQRPARKTAPAVPAHALSASGACDAGGIQ